MENASKALIIAGAILLAIMIIGLGIFVLTSNRNLISRANLDTENITTFNSKYEAYFGDSVPGANVRGLMSLVKATTGDHTIKLNGITGISGVSPAKTYIVKAGDENGGNAYKEGYLINIYIKEN